MSDWGKGAKNNTVGYGQGACDNSVGWGQTQKDSSVAQSWSGDTDISGCSGGGSGLTQVNNVYSMEFDGISDFVLLDNSNDTLNLDYLSISMWFKPDVNANQTIINNSYFTSGNFGWGIKLSPDKRIRFISVRTGSRYVTGQEYNLNEWNHIAVTYDNANGLTLYLNNGTPINYQIGTNSPLIYTSGALIKTGVTIGSAAGSGSVASPGAPSQFFNGMIDEVGIFNYALTDAEILSIYNATAVGKTADLSQLTTPPVAWYRM